MLPSSKEVFLHNFRQFLENWIFDGNLTGADLTKIVKILYYLKLCWEKSFCLNYLLPSSKEVFLHNFKQFWKIEFLTKIPLARGPYKNSENFVLSLIVLRKEFLFKLFVPTKEVFLHNFKQFLENWIFDGNSTGADPTKIVKILYYLKLCSRKNFPLARGPYKNSENFVLSLIVLRKEFLFKLFVTLNKRSVSPQF